MHCYLSEHEEGTEMFSRTTRARRRLAVIGLLAVAALALPAAMPTALADPAPTQLTSEHTAGGPSDFSGRLRPGSTGGGRMSPQGNPIGGVDSCFLSAGWPHMSTSTPGWLGAKANVQCNTPPQSITVQVTLWSCPFPGTVLGVCANEVVAASDVQTVSNATFVEAKNAYIPCPGGPGEYWASVYATSIGSDGAWGQLPYESGWVPIIC
jgi:hypothetical protein